MTRSIALIVAAGAALVAPALAGDQYTIDFGIDSSTSLVPNGENPYWSLRPGRFLRFEGDDDGEFAELEITVLQRIRHIPFFTSEGEFVIAHCRVIEEREWKDGDLVEVSRNYYAREQRTGNIYYFGEDVDIYEDGEIVSHDGAWIVGQNGNQPGLIMPDVYLLGSKYFQEIAPGVAMDRAEHVQMDIDMDTPAGSFEDCVMVRETSPLEPNSVSIKIYAPGVGLIADGPLRLVEYR